MADVFISYARESEALARRMVEALQGEGFEVWWDSELLPHHTFAASIEIEVRKAKSVIVVWSAHAVESQWVRAEADLARSMGKLVQASAEPCVIPLPFNQFQTAKLANWDGLADHPQWRKVVASVAALCERDRSALPAPAHSAEAVTLVSAKPSHQRYRRNLTAGIAAGVIALAAAGSILLFGIGPPHRLSRIAVRPFEAIGHGQGVQELAAGLSDSLQSALSSGHLQTVAKADAESLQGAESEVRAKKLGVGLVFSGTVQSAAAAMTVRVHMDDPILHASLWSAELTAPATESGPLQAQVAARAVAVLSCAAQALAPAKGIADSATLTTFLRACDLAETSYHGSADYQAANAMLDAMREVTRNAPSFAAGHSVLAKHAGFLINSLPGQSANLRKEADEEARRALQLDPKDPDAFVALGLIAAPRDYAQREQLLREALAADPSWPHANGFLGNLMEDLGRVSEASELYVRAASVNPQSTDWSVQAAKGLLWDGQYGQADAELARLAPLWPKLSSIWLQRYSSLVGQKRWGDARALIDNAPPAYADKFPLKDWREQMNALANNDRAAIEMLRQKYLATAAESPISSIQSLAFLGFPDDAFTVADRYPPPAQATAAFLFGPMTGSLRREPRFLTLAAQYGLPTHWRKTGKWPDFCADRDLSYDCRR